MSAHKKINESSLFRAFESSEFRSTKHTNYFYLQDLLKNTLTKKITFVEVGIAMVAHYLCGKIFKENARIIGIDFNPSAKNGKNMVLKYILEINQAAILEKL